MSVLQRACVSNANASACTLADYHGWRDWTRLKSWSCYWVTMPSALRHGQWLQARKRSRQGNEARARARLVRMNAVQKINETEPDYEKSRTQFNFVKFGFVHFSDFALSVV